MSRRALVAVTGVTVLAFVLRVRGMGQSLFGDEVLTYDIIRRPSLVGVLRALHAAPESTPPLHYVLAWAAGKVSAALTDVRLPSLLAGTATVPVVLALGRRLASTGAAWLAAVAFALAPFATFYGTETRAYALATFLGALALLLELRALDVPSRGRWAAFAVAAAAALYTHYTALLVLAVPAVWAFVVFPDRRRPLLLAHAVVALAYVPWLPFLHGSQLALISLTYPLSVGSWFEALARMVVGVPYESLGTLPGSVALVLGAAALVVGLVAPVGARPPTPRRNLVLLAALALACPLGLLLYDAATGVDLVNPRNLSVSSPGLFLLLAVVLTARPALGRLTVPLALAALVIGAVRLQEPEARRPPTAEVAAVLDRQAAPGEPVVESPLFGIRSTRLAATFALNLRRPHRLLGLTGYRHEHGVLIPVGDRRAWRDGPRVWVVGPEVDRVVVLPPAPPGWRRTAHARFAGFFPYAYARYERVGVRARALSCTAGRRRSVQRRRCSSTRNRASTVSVRRP